MKMFVVYRYEDRKCPTCGSMLNAAAASDGNSRHVPRDGDLSVCGICGRFSIITIVDDAMTTRQPTEAEEREYQEYLEENMREDWARILIIREQYLHPGRKEKAHGN